MRAAIYDGSDTSGVAFKWENIPPHLLEEAKSYREKLIEAVADFDDQIANKFLEGEKVEGNELKAGVRKAVMSLQFIPVIPGSAFKNKGVQMLMDAVVDYLPSPLDVVPMKAFNEEGEPIEAVVADDSGKLCGLAFKLWTDPFVGKLVFYRVYRGCLKKGSVLENPRTNKSERVSRLMVMKADSREDLEVAYSGDICALIGAKNVVTGDTLCEKTGSLILEPPSFPEPVIAMSIEPNTKADQQKLSIGLQRLAEEDPTFQVKGDEETGQTIISGMGELHLEIIRDRLFREFKVEAKAGKPQISYRESITKNAEGEGKFIRQTGGRGQYGHGIIKLELNQQGKGNEIINEIVGGSIPKEYIRPFSEGLKEASQNGTVAGYPVVDWKIRIVDGSFHEVDSSETAFKMAGIFAFRDAMNQAAAVLLEPIMSVEVTSPQEYQGDIVGDLNRRRGQIQGMEPKPHVVNIAAQVPLETMFGYATDVRSLSKGRASYSMTPSHFQQAPQSVVESVVATSKRSPSRH